MMKPLFFFCLFVTGLTTAQAQPSTFKKTDRYFFYEQCKRQLGERLTDMELICGTCAETAEMLVSDFTPEQTKRMSPTEIQSLIASMETKMRVVLKKPATQTDNRPLPADDDHTAPLPAKKTNPQPVAATKIYKSSSAQAFQTLTVTKMDGIEMFFKLDIGTEDCQGNIPLSVAKWTAPYTYKFSQDGCNILFKVSPDNKIVAFSEKSDCDAFRGMECLFSADVFLRP